MIVYAFDPGKITGVAMWNTEAMVGPQFYAWQFTVEELYEFVDERCGHFEYAQIEKFTITAATVKKARESEPLDVIGYLKYAAWRCGFKVGWSKPADVMRSFPDAALRKAGLYTPGKGHANDAARHLAWYTVKNGIRPAGDFLI